LGNPTYVIGPGDELRVFVWRNEDLSMDVIVRPDGKISTPLIEDIPAVGRTPSELARDMEQILVEFIRSPTVNVMVLDEGNASQIQVIGSVEAPKGLSYREGIRVLDAIVAAGGLGEFAAGNRSKVVRKIDGKQIECKVRLADLVGKGRIDENIELYPGDVVVVPESRL